MLERVEAAFGRAFGHRVQVGGIRGDVIDIGVLRTTLMKCGQWVDGDLYNGRIVRVANRFVFKELIDGSGGRVSIASAGIEVVAVPPLELRVGEGGRAPAG